MFQLHTTATDDRLLIVGPPETRTTARLASRLWRARFGVVVTRHVAEALREHKDYRVVLALEGGDTPPDQLQSLRDALPAATFIRCSRPGDTAAFPAFHWDLVWNANDSLDELVRIIQRCFRPTSDFPRHSGIARVGLFANAESVTAATIEGLIPRRVTRIAPLSWSPVQAEEIELAMFDGADTGNSGFLETLSIQHPELATVVVTSGRGSAEVLDWIRRGADECIPVSDLTRPALEQVSQRALERRRRMLRLSDARFRDPVTGCLSRQQLFERIERTLASDGDREGSKHGLIVVEVRGLSSINEAAGHRTGDLALRVIAHRLQNATPSRDLVARVGSTRFGVWISDRTAYSDILSLATELGEALKVPIDTGDRTYRMQTAVGIALAPLHGEAPHQLMRAAEVALRHSRRRGPGLQVFQPSRHEAELRSHGIWAELTSALDRGEFFIHYQPQLELPTGNLIGVEALLRWKADGECRMPEDFIPVLEQTGLIREVGAWVLDEACRQRRVWKEMSDFAPRIAVNVSAVQLDDPFFARTVFDTLIRHELEPADIELEITETALIDEFKVAKQTLDRLATAGVRLVVDDFGTGCAFLTYVGQFPFHGIKIDRAYTSQLLTEPRTGALVDAMLGVAASLGLDVLVEGVESDEVIHAFIERDCHAFQGFRLGRPIAPGAMQRWIEDWGRQRKRFAPEPGGSAHQPVEAAADG